MASSLQCLPFEKDSILRLPPEILHLVFSFLKPSEAASLRLLHSKLAAVGMSHLVRQIFLVTTSESFARLQSISEHSELRQSVVSIYYSGIILPSLCREAWEKQISSPERLAERRSFGKKYPTQADRDCEAAQSEMSRLLAKPQHHYDAEKLDVAYGLYQKTLKEQELLVIDEQSVDRIGEAMKLLPRLKEIIFSMGYQNIGVDDISGAVSKVYAATLCRPIDGRSFGSQGGVTQARSLLLGAHHAGLKLKCVTLNVSWHLFDRDDRELQDFGKTVSSVEDLDLLIVRADEDHREMLEEELDEGQALATQKRLLKLITSATKLVSLRLGIDLFWIPSPFNLAHIFGNFHWPTLEALTIGGISTDEESLITIFSRHSSTLECIALYDMSLIEGRWPSVFQRLRTTTQAAEVLIEGGFWGVTDAPDDWYFSGERENGKVKALRACVESYVSGNGSTDEDVSFEVFLQRHGVGRIAPFP